MPKEPTYLRQILARIPAEHVFSVATLADFAELRDLPPFEGHDPQRARAMFTRDLLAFMRQQRFPPAGDTVLRMPDGSLLPAWVGARFQEIDIPRALRELPPEVKYLYAPVELHLVTLGEQDSVETILQTAGIAWLKDIAAPLNVHPDWVKQRSRQYAHPWKEMGVRKLWTHWLVRLLVFRKWYAANVLRCDAVDPNWDGNTLLRQKGKTFRLADIKGLVPFALHQLRYRARSNPRSAEEMGICIEKGVWVVRIDQFAPWVERVWGRSGDFGGEP